MRCFGSFRSFLKISRASLVSLSTTTTFRCSFLLVSFALVLRCSRDYLDRSPSTCGFYCCGVIPRFSLWLLLSIETLDTIQVVVPQDFL